MRHGHNKEKVIKSLLRDTDPQKPLLREAWHPGFVEDYGHQGDLMREPLSLIFSEVNCYALMAALDVMNK